MKVNYGDGADGARPASKRQDGRCRNPSEAGRLLRNRLENPSMGRSIKNLSSVTVVGLDIAKNVFQVHGADVEGGVVVAKPVRRRAALPDSTEWNSRTPLRAAFNILC
jgi:hypothetical protein